MSRSFAIAASAALLCGCASHSYCLGDQPYTHAKSVPPLQPVEGLKIPESNAALKIPPASGEAVPYGRKVKDAKGEEKIECLDRPPPMPSEPTPKPAG
ncbi:MAG TPA: hypothetical protein VFB36_02760 [Nevskiaceae bacterium]|nr:hypothetical protein [Nevskiaceae bacterium]